MDSEERWLSKPFFAGGSVIVCFSYSGSVVARNPYGFDIFLSHLSEPHRPPVAVDSVVMTHFAEIVC
jgi:hypothetical protein